MARWTVWSLALALALVAPASALASERYDVTIRRGEHGIPHVVAGDWGSLGYGYGYALAQDNLCVIAESYVTVAGERSKYFGPDASYAFRANGTTPKNLDSDFFYKRIIATQAVERLVAQPPPEGPVEEVRRIVRGYVAGYNAYLRETGVDRIPDPACRGADWVRPIEEIDAYRRFHQLALLASAGVAIDSIASAQPVAGGAEAAAARERQRRALAEVDPQRVDALLGDLGSNAYGLGRDATANGRGMLLGNPHFPWNTSERFYQAHLTIPGRLNVSGVSLLGLPLINIGYTRKLAWTHTVSTARRFTPFELRLVPGSPTSYVVDGQVRQMKATRLSVEARTPSGIETRTRTLYETEHGPMLTGIAGLPIFPWTPASGYALGDVNATNLRFLNHFFFVSQAQSVGDVDAVLRRYQGIPWVNTLAADSAGDAYYADIGAVPNLPDEKVAQCSSPLGATTNQLLRLQILDGSRGACRWGDDPDAVAPGIFGPSRLPSLTRSDYVTNSNDSYWLTNPEQPLEGYARVIGDERTARSPRTRLGLRIVQQRLDGSDGQAGERFTLRQLQDAVFNNRQYLGEQWRDELVALCRANPTLAGASGPVDVSAACPVLAAWDLRDELDSRGALLFRRFATRALSSPVPVGPLVSPWRDAFSASDPVGTPRGLNTASPLVRQALADAVTDLRSAGIPLDAPLGDWQYEMRGDERIPIHGGPGGVGVFNAINVAWDPKRGYPDVDHGTSYVQAVELTARCPRARTILAYSQSASPESPWFADQTRMYSRKQWVAPPLCERDVARARRLDVTELGRGYRRDAAGRLLTGVRVGGRRALTVSFRPARRAGVRIRVMRGGRRVGVVRRDALPARRLTAVRLPRLRPGRYALEVTATARGRRHTLTRVARVR